jgi:Immunity protein 8
MNTSTLKSIDFGGKNLSNFSPSSPNNFCIWLTLGIGPLNAEGSHLYQLGICTPTWLDNQIQNDGPISGRHMLLVNSFDEVEIRTFIIKTIEKCDSGDWAKTSIVLARHFAWEYEDYQV